MYKDTVRYKDDWLKIVFFSFIHSFLSLKLAVSLSFTCNSIQAKYTQAKHPPSSVPIEEKILTQSTVYKKFSLDRNAKDKKSNTSSKVTPYCIYTEHKW